MKYIIFILIFISTFLNAQNWQRIDSVFSPSGVIVGTFTCPSFADLNSDGELDLLLGNTNGRLKIFTNKNYGNPPQYFHDTALTSSIIK